MRIDEFQVLTEKVDTLQRSMDRIDRDLDADRQDLQQLSIRVGAMEGQVDEMRKSVSGMVSRIQDRVQDAVQPLVEGIEKRKVVMLKSTPWWKNLWNTK